MERGKIARNRRNKEKKQKKNRIPLGLEPVFMVANPTPYQPCHSAMKGLVLKRIITTAPEIKAPSSDNSVN